MRTALSLLSITLLTLTGVTLNQPAAHAESASFNHTPILLAFDGFDDDGGGDVSSDDDSSGSDDSMDGTSTSSSSSSSGPGVGEDAPDAGFRTGYSPDQE